MPTTLTTDPRTAADLASRGFKLNSWGRMGFGEDAYVGYSVVPLEYTARTHGHMTGISKGLIKRPARRRWARGQQPRDMAFRAYRPLKSNGYAFRMRPDAPRFETAVAAAHYLLDLEAIPPYPLGTKLVEKETGWVGVMGGPVEYLAGEWEVHNVDTYDDPNTEEWDAVHQKDLHAKWEVAR